MKEKVCEVLRDFIVERLKHISNTDQIELCHAAAADVNTEPRYFLTDDGLAVIVGDKLYGITIEEVR